MYDKNYKYQSSDEIEGYKLKLYSSRLLMLFFWVVVIVMICLMISLFADVRNAEQFLALMVVFLLEISIPLIGAIWLTYSYRREKKEYFFISKEGIDFYQSSFDTQCHINWEEIGKIYIYPRNRSFGYEMTIEDRYTYTPTYHFTLSWTQRPKKTMRIMKEYSSGNVKIGIKGVFSFRYKWY